jgi:hypothetical protein
MMTKTGADRNEPLACTEGRVGLRDQKHSKRKERMVDAMTDHEKILEITSASFTIYHHVS